MPPPPRLSILVGRPNAPSEQYLADLRNNRPQRPTGTRPISTTAKSRWSLIRSSTAPPDPGHAEAAAPAAPAVDPLDPPSLHGSKPPPLSRRESKPFRNKLHLATSKKGSVQSDGRTHLSLAAGFDPKAVTIALNAVHGRGSKVPKSVDLETLAKIAHFVDRFQLFETVEVYADRWVGGL